FISLLECSFVSQRIPPTERATKVRNFERFSLKTLRCKARARKSQYANTQRTGRCNAGRVSPLACYLVV
ncbi:hypothetical protein GBAR_LOCUS1165, partial [Geodia barretti]